MNENECIKLKLGKITQHILARFCEEINFQKIILTTIIGAIDISVFVP